MLNLGKPRRFPIRRLFLCLLIFVPCATAAPTSFAVSGYLKYLVSLSDTPDSGSYFDHLLHGRADAKWYASPSVTSAIGLRARAFYGGTVERTPGFINQIRTPYEFANLDGVLWEQKRSVGYARD